MKFNIWIILAVIILTNSMHLSQTHELYGGIGYNFPTTTNLIGQNSDLESSTVKTSSFSKGMIVQGGYTLGLTENILIDINLNYLIGVTDENYYSIIDVINDNQGLRYETRTRNFSNENFSINPAIKLKTSLGNFSPYLKFGGSINFIRIQETWDNPYISYWSNVPVTWNYSYKNDYSLGWFSGVGLNYLILPNISMFCELQINSITFYADKGEFNGSSYELKEELPYGFPEDLDWAIKDFPFSSFGILVGLSIHI